MTLEQRIEELEVELASFIAQNEALKDSTSWALNDLSAHFSNLSSRLALIESNQVDKN